MNKRLTTMSFAAVTLMFAGYAPAYADTIPRFGSTCIGSSGQSSDICISSNGRVVSSNYLFRKQYKTAGKHTGCFSTSTKITCSGGSYKTSESSGKMNGVIINLKAGKPVSMAWR